MYNPIPLRFCAALLLAFTATTQVAQAGDTSKPWPAEIMPKAEHSILLSITWTGKQYVAVGSRGHVLTSPDGKKWTQQQVPVRQMLNRVRFLDEQRGWAVGHDRVVLRTDNGGSKWVLQNFDPASQRPANDVLFLDANTGFVGGNSAFFIKTTDGGATWTPVTSDFLELGLNVNALTKLNDGTLVAAGEKGLVVWSGDNGETWNMVKTPYGGSQYVVIPYKQSGAIIFGLRGRVYRTENLRKVTGQDPKKWDEFVENTTNDPVAIKAMGWEQYSNPIDRSLFGGSMMDDGRIVLVGVSGTVLVSDKEKPELYPAYKSTERGDPAPLGDAIGRDNKIIAVGRNGFLHMPMPE